MRTALALALLLAALPALAQVPLSNETRARAYEETVQRQREELLRRNAAPPGPESMRAMEDDRRSLGPDVGRPEAEGRLETGGERGALTGGMNPQR